MIGARRIAAAALAAAALAACARRDLDASAAGARLVTVGAAVTETVVALGAGGDLVGVDRSSLGVPGVPALPSVGYHRTLASEGLLALRPTRILAGSEAGPAHVLEHARKAGVEVETFEAPTTIDGAKARIRAIASAVARVPEGERLAAQVDADARDAEEVVRRARGAPRVVFLYTRGGGSLHASGARTPADAMIALAGGRNALAGADGPHAMEAESIVAADPEWILVPEASLAGLGGVEGVLALPGVAHTAAGRAKRVIAMDDALLLGFGPRVGRAIGELARKLHGAAP